MFLSNNKFDGSDLKITPQSTVHFCGLSSFKERKKKKKLRKKEKKKILLQKRWNVLSETASLFAHVLSILIEKIMLFLKFKKKKMQTYSTY